MSFSDKHYHQTEEKKHNTTELHIMMNLAKYLAEENLITPDEKVKLLDFLRKDKKG